MGDSGRAGGATVWHHAFYQLVIERCPRTCEVHTEVPVSQQPGRVDLVLVRRGLEPWRDDDSHLLRGLWPRLGLVTLVELKTPGRGFRAFELSRLMRHGMEYHERNSSLDDDELSLALLVPAMNLALRFEIERLGFRLEPLGGGYARLAGQFPYTIHVVFLNEVAEVERDEYLRLFTTGAEGRDPRALCWLNQWRTGTMKTVQEVRETEGYHEIMAEILATMTAEERMIGLTPEQRLAGLAPEQVLAGLAPEEIERLRALLATRASQ